MLIPEKIFYCINIILYALNICIALKSIDVGIKKIEDSYVGGCFKVQTIQKTIAVPCLLIENFGLFPTDIIKT